MTFLFRYDLLKLCLEGPKEKLDQTVYCQPAVMVTSFAALELLKDECPKAIESCIATAGFSLGEITSLVFAGAITFDQGKRILVKALNSPYKLDCHFSDRRSSRSNSCRSNANGLR